MSGSHVDLSIAPPINVYIVTGCGNGCQASTVHPRVCHRPATAPLAKEFAAIRHLPSVVQAVLGHLSPSWMCAKKINLLSLAVNLFVDCCLPPAI